MVDERECIKCLKVIKVGVYCTKCCQWFHNKCEKRNPNLKNENYICKNCVKSLIEAESMTQDSALVSDRCFMFQYKESPKMHEFGSASLYITNFLFCTQILIL